MSLPTVGGSIALAVFGLPVSRPPADGSITQRLIILCPSIDSKQLFLWKTGIFAFCYGRNQSGRHIEGAICNILHFFFFCGFRIVWLILHPLSKTANSYRLLRLGRYIRFGTFDGRFPSLLVSVFADNPAADTSDHASQSVPMVSTSTGNVSASVESGAADEGDEVFAEAESEG